MKKKLISAVLSLSLAATMCGGFATTASAAAKTPQYQATARLMEELNRGGFVAANPSSNVSTAGGVYLSWRLLGDESLDTCFNIYKNGTCIKSNLHNTNYIDTSGRTTDKYTVAPVVNGVEGAQSETFAAYTGTVESSWKNSPYAYFDIKTSTPPSGTGGCTYTENDASVGDVDGDGDYELILKWDPSNSKDSSKSGVTGHVYIDCYEMDPDGDGTPKWRIDLGGNIRAGAHYTQFQVFDYDGDGYAEVAIKTAPGTVDGTGKYVTAAGNTDKIRNADNSASYVGSNGHITGGPEYLTIFNGETGAAMQTIDYGAPLGDVRSWGDSTYNRSDRFLAGTAYLDGVHPSIIMARGYYKRAVVMAYDWDGTDLIPKWITDSSVSGNSKLAASGNHNLSVADLDNDGYDEIIYGSAAVDHDGKVMHSMGWGHGDALHVSDFDNDGEQEIFGALEGDPNWGVGFRTADGTEIWHKKASDDDGRGIMANFSEQYGVLAWDAAFGVMDIDGKVIVEPHENPNTGEMTTAMDNNQSYGNFNIYWDDDLLSEHYDKGRIQKWYDSSLSFGRLLELPNVTHNNGTKQNPCLQADLFGDWREELVMRKSDGTGVRVFTSLIPTNYMLTTLMHDSQYRCAIAWQNTGYNIPPHTSYFIGTESLATDASGNALNYLAPAVNFTTVEYPELIGVTGVKLSENSLNMGLGFTTQLKASLEPADATNKAVTWTSSDSDVVKVDLSGNLTAVSVGKATITVTTKEGGFTDTCEVKVLPVTKSDATGDEVFKTDNTDAESVLSSQTATGASFAQNDARVGGNLYREFEQFTDNKATLSYTFNTGGNMFDGNNWNWVGHEYSFYMQLLDGDNNIIKLSQAQTTGAQPTMAQIGGSNGADVKSTWSVVGDLSNNPMGRSSSIWNVTVEFDYDNDSATITVLNADKTGGYTTTFALEGKHFSKLVFGSKVDGAGGITWTPSVRDVAYTRTAADVPHTDFVVKTVDNKTATVQVAAEDDMDSAIVVGVLYNNDDTVKEVKTTEIKDLKYAVPKTASVEFENVVDESKMKMYLWDSLKKMVPLSAPIVRTAGALGTVNVVKVFGGNQVGAEEPIELKPGSAYTVPDTAKADIEYKGKVLEYDPDNSDLTRNVTVGEGSTTIKLAYKLKSVPTGNDTEIAHVYISENGTGEGISWMGETYAYKTDSSGVKYVEFTDDGTNPMTVTFDNKSDSLVMEFDVMMKDIEAGGDVFGLVPYSDSTAGVGVGFRRNGDGTRWEPTLTLNAKYLTVTNDSYKAASTYQDEWTHIIMVCSNGKARTTYTSMDGTVYVENSWEDSVADSTVGTAALPINKVVFGRGYGSGSGTMGIRNFKAYALDTASAVTTKEKQIDIPGAETFAMSVTHASDVAGVSYDASLLMGDITYEIQDDQGNVATPEGLSIDANGLLTAGDSFDVDTAPQYKVVVKLGGQPWYVYNLTYRGKALVTNTQSFDSGLNGFAITNKTGYAVEADNGTVKYTKTAGTANDASVWLTYPITTSELSDEFEVSFDMMAKSGAFKGYIYIVNGSGAELLKMETHMYQPRFKVPSGTATIDFKSDSGFNFGSWYTVVLGYSNGNETMKIYQQSDTERENPLVSTEFTTSNTAAGGLTFKWQVAQNVQNGNVNNTDEYYFDNFAYSYYDYN